MLDGRGEMRRRALQYLFRLLNEVLFQRLSENAVNIAWQIGVARKNVCVERKLDQHMREEKAPT
ncbi:MAG: hypothetical protein EOO82_02480 [Oxalobacteraceae bacterium]|nr:MAG: hypothetical protein EOO82_02480 [Oxalobacteraceae bacterium]